MPRNQAVQTPAPSRGAVVTKAVVKAAEHLGLSARTLGGIIGVSEPTVSRMKSGNYALGEGTKPYELAVLVVRVFRSLDAIAGGDPATVRGWMTSQNLALGDTPLNRINSVSGLVDVISYLDARRALV
jgi:hypothetical protein